MSKLATVYDRWSPRPEADEAAKSTYRIDSCKSYCAFAGLQIASILSDPETSGRTVPLAKRESGASLERQLASGEVSHVVTYSLSRLFRDNIDGQITLERWRKANVTLHLASEGGQCLHSGSATGRFLLRVLLAKEQLEPELTAERTSRAMKSHQANGRKMGSRAPYGFRIEGDKLVKDEREYYVLLLINQAHSLCNPPSVIAQNLNDVGRYNRKGKPWHAKSISRILQRNLIRAPDSAPVLLGSR